MAKIISLISLISVISLISFLYFFSSVSAVSPSLIHNSEFVIQSSSFPATLRFFAFADNDQMPITRLAVDWGDGSPVYQVKGWFKNRKPWCDTGDYKVCNKDLNRPCQKDSDCGGVVGSCVPPVGTDNRLHFGNSSDACSQGYYQFTHLYTCLDQGALPACSYSAGKPTNAPCWDSTKSACVFVPKVQVLDNWGWCNSEGGGGKWNDAVDSNGQPLEDDKKACYTGQPNTKNPWTSFSGTIEVKP